MTTALRRNVAFDSEGVTCRAWVYTPRAGAARPAPCIVMAHGLGGTRDAALEPYAQAFAQAGFFVLLFDYRYLGASDGAPRQLISIPRQLEDWAAAIAFARCMAGVDPRRIALWGSSLSGGHVLVAAARDPEIAAVSAQCPMLDGAAAARMLAKDTGLATFLRLGAAALVDRARALLGLSPYYVPLVAPPGQFAAMASHDAFAGCNAIMPPGWRNEVAARIFLVLPCYRPIRAAKSVKCPVLLIACEKDSVTSPQTVIAAAAQLGETARLVELPIGHFDVYLGRWFVRSSEEQVAFFKETLCS
jgi:pimeloyl-ACP methyl ester carboxylesterase